MAAYSHYEFDQDKVQSLIQRYTDLRLRDSLLSDSFSSRIRSNNGHIYLKMLRENIAEELKLTEGSQVSDLAFDKIKLDENLRIDANGKYSLQHLNNTEAMGYDNLEQRAAQPELNRDLAHPTVFDKMIADYFLQKRGQYVATNELID